ncbi:MAG: selenide, water dikinase [Candidatus Binatota bacterium]|nr:selenide, water dikinase [Candidatus Binatota bacterium]
MDTCDDAGVFRLRDDLAIVNTVDFFTPIVDDPYTYGAISAANSLSDVYAMGGVPRTAMNVVCFPQKDLPIEILGEILAGGAAKAEEAGVVVVGGHTVEDPELKYGMAVTGTIDPRRVIRNVGAVAGDAVVLSKPLGTGILTTALKHSALSDAAYRAAVVSMTTLNRGAAEAMLRHQVHAATDVTGFGLLGHAHGMARGSDVTLRLDADALPLLPDVEQLASAGHLTGGCKRNRTYLAPSVWIAGSVAGHLVEAAFDPQTSGGLLVALPATEADAYVEELRALGLATAARIGVVVARRDRWIELV